MVYGIIVGGGKGKRLGKQIPKSMVSLRGIPIFAYSLNAFIRSQRVDAVVLVLPEDYVKIVSRRMPKLEKEVIIVPGGQERHDSVLSALEQIKDREGVVAIHDASRPFISSKLIDEAVSVCERENVGVILALPVSDTLKLVKHEFIAGTIDRRMFYLAQTPQVFPFNQIYDALNSLPKDFIPTDDAQAVELVGGKVKILKGSSLNFKITYPEDLSLAEALVQCFSSSELPPDSFRSLDITKNCIS